MNNQKYKLEESIGHLVAVTHRRMHKRLSSNFAQTAHDITPDQWSILISLLNRGELYQSQLATHHNKDRSGIKRIVDGLVSKGMVAKRSSDDDTRTNIVSLTERGSEIVEQLIPITLRSLDEALVGFSDTDETTLKRLLNKIIRNLD